MQFILISLFWIFGICTMGYHFNENGMMQWLINYAVWIWAITIFCFLFGYFKYKRQLSSKHHANFNAHSKSKFQLIVMAMTCFSIFLLGQCYAEHQLAQRLKQRIDHVAERTEIIYVNKIDEQSTSQEKVRLKQQVQWVNPTHHHTQTLLLYLPDHVKQMPLELGQYYRVAGKIKPAHSYAVPHVFDQEKWLIQQNIMGTMQVKHVEAIDRSMLMNRGFSNFVRSNSTLLSQFKLAAEKKRLQFRALLIKQPLHNKGLLLALLTGDESLLSEQVQHQFKTLGISHLLAISGPHVLIFALIICFIFNIIISKLIPQLWLRVPRPYFLIFPFMGCVVAYTAFVGFEVPALRTCLTVGIIGFILVIKQQIHAFKLLLMSASLLLVFDPFSILSAAFWLSYGACFILIRVYQTIIQQSSNEKDPIINSHWIMVKLYVQVLIESQWKVFIALFPLVALIFGQVSWLSPLVNLIAIPMIGAIIVPLEVIGAVLSQIISPLGLLFFHIADVVISLLLKIFDLFQSIFQARLSWLALSPMMILSIACGVIILFLPKGVLPKLWAPLCFAPLLLGLNRQPEFSLTILDVGQGQAVFLNTAQQKMLIDTGGSFDESQFSVADNIVVPYLMGEGIRHLDHVLLSHLDQDHAGAFEKLNAQINISQVSSNQRDSRFQHAQFEYCYKGQTWKLKGVTVQVLAPPQNSLSMVPDQQNELSCIVYVQATKAKGLQNFLIMGDAGWAAEYWLMQHYPDLKVDVLVLGHHGSQHSSSYAFLNHYHPKLAIASAGFNNRYGHPHPMTQTRLKALSIPFITTIEQGSIGFELQDDGEMRELHHRQSRAWLMR